MPRNTSAGSPVGVIPPNVDELIQLGRERGHVSLTELRSAFAAAGLSPARGREILRELAEAGLDLGNGQV